MNTILQQQHNNASKLNNVRLYYLSILYNIHLLINAFRTTIHSNIRYWTLQNNISGKRLRGFHSSSYSLLLWKKKLQIRVSIHMLYNIYIDIEPLSSELECTKRRLSGGLRWHLERHDRCVSKYSTACTCTPWRLNVIMQLIVLFSCFDVNVQLCSTNEH